MRLFLRCLAYFTGDLPHIIWSLVLTALATVVTLLQPFVVAVLFDTVLGDRAAGGWVQRVLMSVLPAGKAGQIIGLAALGLLVTILGALLTMAQTMASVKVGYHGLIRVRCDLFQKLQKLSLAYHRDQPQGDAIYRLSSDTLGFQSILNLVVGNILVSLVTLAVMVWIMVSVNWRLAIIATSVVPLLMWAHQWSQRTLMERWGVAKEVETGLTTSIQRSIASMWLMQAFRREADEFSRFNHSVTQTVKAMIRVHWREVIYGLLVTMILGLGAALILGYGGWLVYRDQFILKIGAAGMTIGKLYLFLAYLDKFYAPLNKLTGSGTGLAQSAVQAQRVFEVLDRDPDIQDAPDAIVLPQRPRVLELADVTFDYKPGKPVLRGISATIKPGQMVAFVGSSGAGKSTLLNLLPRFYDPTGGALLLDGHDLRGITLASLRRHVALVLQESMLLPTTVAENIAYGRPDATPAEIRNAAEISGAADFIAALPAGYDTPINENANNLSGGQKQRLAIARALLTEAPIMLLDEPTSALDPHNEQMITETLRDLKRQRTIILVSHRLSTVADCDCIYVMADGQIIEQGTHEQLIARHGAYFRMAKHQMKLGEEIQA